METYKGELMTEINKGTTTVGIVCSNGIVLATDSRATMGHFIASSKAKKVYQIDNLIGMTIAGSVGDAQRIVRWLQVEAKLYQMRREEPMTIKAITNLLGGIMNNSRAYPFSVSLLVGGVDKNGNHLYSLDAIGGIIDESVFVSTGSGSPIAYGVLEDRYRPGIDTDDGVELAVRALHTAMSRDSASGNNIKVVVIRPEGYTEISDEMILQLRQNL